MTNHINKYIMKKLTVLLAFIGGFVLTSNATPFSISINSYPGTMTNVVTGPVKVTSMIVVALDATNASGSLIDTATNIYSVATPAYTNTISFGTNYISFYTNYFGVLTYLTNFVLVDITNNPVSAGTFTYPTTSISALASA